MHFHSFRKAQTFKDHVVHRTIDRRLGVIENPGGVYGGAMYSNSMYREGYGGVYKYGMYGGGLYNSSFGGPMGGYGMGISSAYGIQDRNNPYGAPPSPPGF